MSTNPPSTAAEPADSTIHDARHRRTVLIAVCIALMAVIASVTGLNVAQPEFAVEFDASQSEVLWFINLYTISLAALLLPLGALGDRWGRKPMLLIGLTIFGVSKGRGSGRVLGDDARVQVPVRCGGGDGIGVWTAVAVGGGILGVDLSALHQLHRQITARDRRLQTPASPWSVKSLFRVVVRWRAASPPRLCNPDSDGRAR